MMKNISNQPTTIDEYIARCPKGVQPVLEKIRAVIREAAPEATEKISYRMPGFHLNGDLIWFAAFRRHIGIYPTGSAMEGFVEDLSAYRSGKGTLQFPLDKPIPYDLIARIVRHRVAENQKKLR